MLFAVALNYVYKYDEYHTPVNAATVPSDVHTQVRWSRCGLMTTVGTYGTKSLNSKQRLPATACQFANTAA